MVWIGSDADPYLDRHASALSRHGLIIERSLPAGALGVTADVRVLPTSAFDRSETFIVEYPLDPRPTLLLGESAADVEDLLRLARNSDEVGHSGEGPAVLARRIARLVGRAESYWRAEQGKDSDPLTGLWNRRRFAAEFEALTAEAKAAFSFVGIALFDLDHFKLTNDRLGHAAGDTVLRMTAAAIRRRLKATDRTARWGGEEFIVFMPRGDVASVIEDAEAIRKLIGEIDTSDLSKDDPPLRISASAGLALYRPGFALKDLLTRADMALYAAKGDGRDRLISYESLELPMADGDQEIQVRHFRNVTRVVTERVANMISLMGEHVVRSIRQEADQDALTGVNNRRYFDKRITREFGLVEKHGLPLTLVFLDIDNFGQFNRSFGAPTGDAVLRQFAEVVSAAIRPVDWMARYGGEEFCVVMPATFDEALVAAERLRVMVAEAELSTFDAQRVRITVSIGVAEHRDASELPDSLVQRASKALQEAKRLGRNQVRGAPPA